MSQPQSHDRVNELLSGGFLLGLLVSAFGGLRNSELTVDIGFYAAISFGTIRSVRYFITRRRRNRAARHNRA